MISRRRFLLSGVAASSLPFLAASARAQEDTRRAPELYRPESPADEMAAERRTAWFREAKFGMFVHWGPYSLASVEASWPIMKPGNWGISEADYRALPKRFNPTKYDPNHFIDMARLAGQRYMVFTTKHHDGFCMFDSSYTDYKITNTPYGKDIVRLLVDACAERSMALGFYYSPPDLNNPNYRDTTKPARENWNGQPERPEWPVYLDYMDLQLTELLTRYGRVRDIWFDGLYRQEKYDGRRFLELIARLQPETLVNDRIGLVADYVTPEQFIPKAIPTRDVGMRGWDQSIQKEFHTGTVPTARQFQLWETCMTINQTWAYNAKDRDFKSTKDLIRALVEVTSRGGNFLLNVGPQPDGLIQPEFQERLRGVGKWTAVNGESIYGSTFGPVQGESAFRMTARGTDLYVHVFDWPAEGTLRVPGLSAKVHTAYLLATGQAVKAQQTEAGVTLSLPTRAPDSAVSVVALRTM